MSATERDEMGLRARHYVAEHYDFELLSGRLVGALNEVATENVLGSLRP
jgi:hypothetical protein